MICQCLGQCDNITPQPRQKVQQMKQGTAIIYKGSWKVRGQLRIPTGGTTWMRTWGDGKVTDRNKCPPPRTDTNKAERMVRKDPPLETLYSSVGGGGSIFHDTPQPRRNSNSRSPIGNWCMPTLSITSMGGSRMMGHGRGVGRTSRSHHPAATIFWEGR